MATTSDGSGLNDIPLQSVKEAFRSSSSTVPFPSSKSDQIPATIPDSESSTSQLTSSDKLSALPLQSPSNLSRLRHPSRSYRRSLDASTSLPSLDSSPGSHAPRLPPSTSLRASESEDSIGRDTPKQRVSFDSDRGSLPATLQNIRQAVASRAARLSDSAVNSFSGDSPAPHVPQSSRSPRKEGAQTPLSRSPSASRAASPLRLFGWGLHRAHSRDEPFVPVDPFQLRMRWFTSPKSTPQRRPLDLDFECEDTLTTCLPNPCTAPRRKLRTCGRTLNNFIIDTLLRQLYLHILLRLPSFYFSRVARIFQDAEVSKHEIQRMIEMCSNGAEGERVTNGAAPTASPPPFATAGSPFLGGAARRATIPPYPEEWVPPAVSPALARFKNSWEQFVDSLLREWKTLNLVSVLLFTAILTMFQVPDAAGDPLTRWSAVLSLVFALMSLTYGCMYIVQFGTMRSMYKASRWAEEAHKTKTFIWWNIWVLLATPAVWLAWSMIAFCVSILSFVWRTGASSDPADGQRDPLTPTQALVVRVLVTTIFGLGVLNFVMIIRTFGTYGEREPGRVGRWGSRGDEGDVQKNRERRLGMEPEVMRGRGQNQKDTGTAKPPMGLGLSGLSGSGNGIASTSGINILAEEDEDEKGSKDMVQEDVFPVEKERGGRWRISPKL